MRGYLVFRKRLVFLVVPLQLGSGWKALEYSRIPANRVFNENGRLVVDVSKSAGPLVFPFESRIHPSGFKVSGHLDKLIEIPKEAKQGDSKNDDFQLRVGFVLEGKKRPGFFEGMFAPRWLKALFKMGQNFEGIDYVQFYDLASAPVAWSERVHPLNEYLREKVVGKFEKAGGFSFDIRETVPKRALGLWLSSDGDDTKSTYRMTIHSLEVKEAKTESEGKGSSEDTKE